MHITESSVRIYQWLFLIFICYHQCEYALSQNISIEIEKCAEYKKQIFEEVRTFSYLIHDAPEFEIAADSCKSFTPLIVGGSPAHPKEFPHAARLGNAKSPTDVKWFCGGTLLNEKFVLTAAHCFFSKRGEVNRVRLGELDFNSDTDDANPEDFNVKRTIQHPKYKDLELIYNDIGLIELDRNVIFNKYKHPACLPIANGNEFNEFIAIGWGDTAFASTESSILRKVQLQRYSDNQCRSQVDAQTSIDLLRFGLDDQSQICAGSSQPKDTCNGDSGGPLLAYHEKFPCMYYVVGITSTGIGDCGIANLPAIYTRVYNYLTWIREIIWQQ